MTTMNQELAAFYNTNGEKTAAAPAAEDLEKQAQYELFTKLAQTNGIDLSKMNDAQIEQLFTDTFSKTAGEMPPQFAAHAKGGDKDEKKEEKKDGEKSIEDKAKEEHEEKKAMATKIAEADYIGRVIAHAMWQEKTLIEKQAAAASTAAAPAANTDQWTVELPKLASAIDTLAMHRAFEMVQEFNKTAAADKKVDEKDAATKIAQVHTKGLAVTVKTAAAADHKAAVEIRALETLEAAGYPVEWK